MQLSTRQVRVFTLATLLPEKKRFQPLRLFLFLNAQELMLTPRFKRDKRFYGAEIKYSKASRAYQMTERGLDSKALRRMREALSARRSSS